MGGFEALKIETPEERFNKPEILEFDDFPKGKVEIVDIDPPDKKTEIPLLVVPGWSATAEVLKENSQIFSGELGRRTITLTSPHGLETEPNEDVPLAELRKAASITRVIEEKNLEKVDAVVHSEAALFTTAAALENPEKFRSIVYMAPAGLVGEDTFWNLAKRFGTDLFQQWKDRKKSPERESKINTALIEAFKTYASPKKSLDEVKAIADMQIQKNLLELKSKGVKIVIVHPVGDKAFPMEKMQTMLKKGMVDGFISAGDVKKEEKTKMGEIAETHNAWYLTPRPYTKAVDAILNTFESKNESQFSN